MTTTLYITRTGDMIRPGKPAEVTLDEYPEISRTWIRRIIVELPAGFEAAEAGDGRNHIFRGSDCYELTANADRGRLCPYAPRQLPAACVASYGPQVAIFAPVSGRADHAQKGKTSVKAICKPVERL